MINTFVSITEQEVRVSLSCVLVLIFTFDLSRVPLPLAPPWPLRGPAAPPSSCASSAACCPQEEPQPGGGSSGGVLPQSSPSARGSPQHRTAPAPVTVEEGTYTLKQLK